MRVGAVSYLNSKPLIYGLESRLPPASFSLDLPSRLADQLADEQLDVALIPVIEAIRNPAYAVVSDACIACRGPVWSVKLLSRKPFESIKTLALDEGSRTSVALAQVLLAKRFSLRPELSPFPIGASLDSIAADSLLIIGDRAMADHSASFPYQWDLGEEWIQETGLPFVFAVWTARASLELADIDGLLSEARDRGVESFGEIAKQHAGELGLTPSKCIHYLRDNLHFNLGSEERAGLSHFLSECSRLDLCDATHELTYYDCQTT